MFNIILNTHNRNVINTITLSELVSELRNPSPIHKMIVDRARSIDKKSKEYSSIKQSLPCFVPNFKHKDYVKTDSIQSSTGYLYIDIDYKVDIDFSNYPFVAAAWSSLSGIGKGILVSVDLPNSDLDTMRSAIIDICNTMDIKPDTCAVSRDRLNVIGYDSNVYYNENHTKYSLVLDNQIELNSNTKNLIIQSNTISKYRLSLDDNFYDGDLRYDNLEDFTKDFQFEDDELYKDMTSSPIEYTSIYIPREIPNGSREVTLFKILSGIRGLNPTFTYERLLGFAYKVNHSVCEEPLDDKEIENLCLKIINDEIKLFPNKKRSTIFNPLYSLTGAERKSISISVSNVARGRKTTDSLLMFVEDWDVKTQGKFTMVALAEVSGVSYSTVTRRSKEIKNFVKSLG